MILRRDIKICWEGVHTIDSIYGYKCRHDLNNATRQMIDTTVRGSLNNKTPKVA